MAATPVITLPTPASSAAAISQWIRTASPSAPQLATSPGTLIGDSTLAPAAQSDAAMGVRVWYISQQNNPQALLALETDTNQIQLLAAAYGVSPAQMLAQVSADIGVIGAKFGVTKLQPTPANGTALLCTATAPQSDINVGVGTIVTANNGQTFVSTAAVVFPAAQAASYYNATLQLYAFPVSVQATNPGSAGNIAPDSIVSLQTSIAGISYVTNTAYFIDGTDLETDAAFVARFEASWTATGRVTNTGIQEYVTSAIPGLGDVFVAPDGDISALRGNGKADAWIQNQIPVTVSETFNAYNHPSIPNAILPSQGPLLSLTAVSSGTAFAQLDTTSVLQGSVSSQDAIRFTAAPTFPLTVTYVINAAPGQAQALYGPPDPNGVTPAAYQVPQRTGPQALQTSLLFHQALQALVQIAVAIQITPGYQAASVIAAVGAAINTWLQSQDLGATIYVTDLENVIEAVTGVLRQAGEPTQFGLSGQTGVQNSITVADNVAFLPGNVLITTA
jgi:uncharacterized phage protein gp47/JayE